MNKNKRNFKKILAAICAFSGAFGGDGASAALKNKKSKSLVTTGVKAKASSKSLSLNRTENKGFFTKAFDLVKANPIKSSFGLVTALGFLVGVPVIATKLGKSNDGKPNGKPGDKGDKLDNGQKKEIKEIKEENQENQENKDNQENQENQEKQENGENKENQENKEEIKEKQENVPLEPNVKNDASKEKQNQEVIDNANPKIILKQEVNKTEASINLNNSKGEGLGEVSQDEMNRVSATFKPLFGNVDVNKIAVFKLSGSDKYIIIFDNDLKLLDDYKKHLKKIQNTKFSNIVIYKNKKDNWIVRDGVDLSFDEQNKFNLVKK